MNESIGGSLLLNLVIIVVGVMIAIFTASFAYTKAYKAKSIIIKTIEDNHGFDESIVGEINQQLQYIGYRQGTHTCSNKNERKLVFPIDTRTKSSYCIYQIVETDNKGNENVYYEVYTKMYFDIPLISFSLPVKGQTISFRETMINIED